MPLAKPFIPDEKYRDYATDTQWKYYLAYAEHGSYPKAAKELGVSHQTIARAVQVMKLAASRKGYAPEKQMTRPVADGFFVKGVSTYYDQDGEVKGQWVKSQVDQKEQQSKILEAVEAFKDELPRAKPLPPPKLTNKNLLVAYPVGDHHIASLSWHEETGSDYDIKISEELLVGAVEQLARQAPDSQQAALILLGDTFHYDSMETITPAHHNQLDSDTRPALMVRAGIRIIRKCMEILLKKHKHVTLIIESGNHDPYTSTAFREFFHAFYEDEKRAAVDTSPMVFHFLEFGKNIIMTHHGDKVKMQDLPMVLAQFKAEAWGKTKYRYIMTGHVHHDQRKEFNGVLVESFRILPPADAYAAGKGFLSTGRDMKAIVYHSEYGEVGRSTVNPDMIK